MWPYSSKLCLTMVSLIVLDSLSDSEHDIPEAVNSPPKPKHVLKDFFQPAFARNAISELMVGAQSRYGYTITTTGNVASDSTGNLNLYMEQLLLLFIFHCFSKLSCISPPMYILFQYTLI